MLIYPNSFLVELSKRTLGLFWKLGLWFFKVIKLLFLPVINDFIDGSDFIAH